MEGKVTNQEARAREVLAGKLIGLAQWRQQAPGDPEISRKVVTRHFLLEQGEALGGRRERVREEEGATKGLQEAADFLHGSERGAFIVSPRTQEILVELERADGGEGAWVDIDEVDGAAIIKAAIDEKLQSTRWHKKAGPDLKAKALELSEGDFLVREELVGDRAGWKFYVVKTG